MSGFTVRLEGFEKLEQTLKNLPKEKLQQVDDEVEATLFEIATKAKQRVPVDMGQLNNSITLVKTGPLKGEVAVQKYYAPFVNFGTGQFAAAYLGSVDAEWSAYARQFYINGKGTVRGNGFFTSAVDEGRKELIRRVAKIFMK